jgi:hypothetical protein
MKVFWYRRGLIALASLAGVGLLLIGGLYAAVSLWPEIGAQGAEALRGLIGEEAVANLEMTALQIEDTVHSWVYKSGAAQPAAPWTATSGASLNQSPSTVPSSTTTKSNSLVKPSTSSGTKASSPSAPLTTSGWTLAVLQPLGTLSGEGQWSSYIQDSSGRVVAQRTFLQPDASRPYALAAVVAFDLGAAHLHFVLGSEEPASSILVSRPGKIPASDLQPGQLLAAFNGGFKAEHGHFGAMINGVTVLPPRAGLGTIAIYDDGTVRLGVWGADITASPHILAWRQNGPLIIHDGQINPHTADHAPWDWGRTVNGVTATWRSALGISADGRTLYYIGGPSLTLTALAQAMAATGAAQAVQLDINNYWVHFDAFQPDGSGLQALPLLDAMKRQADNRYLKGFTRDFFYLTAGGG